MRKLSGFLAVLCCLSALGAATTQPSSKTQVGDGKVVGLDYFFNHQVRNGAQFHYIWDDTRPSGYSKFGGVWEQYGAALSRIKHAPTRADLDQLSIFIIVNPSTTKNAAGGQPNYMNAQDADTIAAWVNDGGVLALFANDKNNCELEHYNILSQRFGITLNIDLRNTVPTPTAADRAHGTFFATQFPDHPLFKDVPAIFMKEICTLQVKDPAQALLVVDNEQGTGKDIIMATAHYGKGLVFAVGDPWFYNEYIDLKSPPLPIDNRKAAENFCRWLLSAATLPRQGAIQGLAPVRDVP
jgi:unsaturated rhamnogalacturonyl hydrolase